MSPKKIALLTDSCADISPRLAKEKGIFVVPLRILCRDGEYRDGVDITPDEVYCRLREGELPKTSLPSGEDIGSALEEIVKEGYEGVIAFMLSSGLSGTFNVARLIGEECEGKLEVAVFDSLSASLGQGMMVLQLAEDIKAGMSWEELVEHRAPQLVKDTTAHFSVDTLEYLEKMAQEGVKMCILTASEADYILPALDRLDIHKYFDHVLTCTELGKFKDDGAAYLSAMELLGGSLNETVVFEDAYYAVKGAKSAGFAVYAILDEEVRKDDIDKIKATADICFHSYKEIME